MIPVADLDKIPQLFQQLYLAEKGVKNRANPFKFGAERKSASLDKRLVSRSVQFSKKIFYFFKRSSLTFENTEWNELWKVALM